jgi:glyoxylase-like metal-dependent hydrolase (beta-lactamase superfamily II)
VDELEQLQSAPGVADAAPDPPLPEWPEELRPGRAVEVAPGVTRIIAPNPGYMTGPGTNTYLLGDTRLALIDPGPDDDAHLAVLLEAVGDRLGWVLVTHTHIDHSPLALRLQQATGATVLGFGPAPVHSSGPLEAHDSAFAPDRRLGEGDRLDTGELAIDAVYTPGHTSNHLCFELAGTGLLFSGDHVMSGSTVVIAPPDGDMAVYLESLRRVRQRAPRRIAPGHGDVIEDPAAVLDHYLRHRTEREAQVLAGVRTAPTEGITAEQLVAAIYTDVPAHLHPVARYSVWAHLRKLAAEGRATTAELDDLAAPWHPASNGDRSGLSPA